MSILQRRALSSYEGQYLIESERDRFELFYSLIPYLKELESCIDAREEALNRKSQAEETLKMPIFSTLMGAVLYTITLAIPFLIVFYIATNIIKLDNGQSLFSAYETWMEKEPLSYAFMGLIAPLEEKGGIFSFIAILLGVVFVVTVLPCVYVLFPIVLILCIITGIFARQIARQDIKESSEICDRMDINIKQLIQAIDIPIQMVPPDYQYSDAIEYFCNCYINGRVHTLQEAIDAYDTYLHRRKMEHAQEVIHNDQEQILKEIHEQQEKLDRMQDTIRRVKNKVDWL